MSVHTPKMTIPISAMGTANKSDTNHTGTLSVPFSHPSRLFIITRRMPHMLEKPPGDGPIQIITQLAIRGSLDRQMHQEDADAPAKGAPLSFAHSYHR